MSVRIITPAEPVVLPSDLGGEHAGSSTAELAIATATGQLTVLVGRSFGPQTIEYVVEHREVLKIFLPYPPVIEIEQVAFVYDGGETVVDEGAYQLVGDAIVFAQPIPSHQFAKVTYRAGYDGQLTGELPSQIKQAIILKARMLSSVLDEKAFVRVDQVEGIGRMEFAVPEQVSSVIDSAIDTLVAGLKVHAL